MAKPPKEDNPYKSDDPEINLQPMPELDEGTTPVDLDDVLEKMREHEATAPALPPPLPPKKKKQNRLAKWILNTSLITGIAGLGTTAYVEHGNVTQNCDISDVPVKDGKVTCDTQDFFQKILSKNNHIVFGDTDHTAEEIPLFVAAHAKELKEAGVDAVCIELDRDHQPNADHYVKGHFSYQELPTYDYLNRECKKYGIELVLMDVGFKSDSAKEAADKYFACMKAYKNHGTHFSTTEKYLGPGCEDFLRERREANATWTELIHSKGFKKTVTLCGTYHTENPRWFTPDTDEMMAEQGGAVYITLNPSTRHQSLSITRETSWIPTEETPEFAVHIPELPDEIIKKMNYPLFEHLVQRGEWDNLMSAPETTRAFTSMSWPSYMAMQTTGEHDYIKYHKHVGFDQYKEFKDAGHLDWLDSPHSEQFTDAYYAIQNIPYINVVASTSGTGLDLSALDDLKKSFWTGDFAQAVQHIERHNKRVDEKQATHTASSWTTSGVMFNQMQFSNHQLATFRMLALADEHEHELHNVVKLTNDHLSLTVPVYDLLGDEETRQLSIRQIDIDKEWYDTCHRLQSATYQKDMASVQCELQNMTELVEEVRNQPKPLRVQINEGTVNALEDMKKEIASYQQKHPQKPDTLPADRSRDSAGRGM